MTTQGEGCVIPIGQQSPGKQLFTKERNQLK